VEEVKPTDRQSAWRRAWSETTTWASRFFGIVTLGVGSVIASAWAGYFAAHQGHPADQARHLQSTEWPVAAQVTVIALGFATGLFLTFLGSQSIRFAVTPVRQRDEARDEIDTLQGVLNDLRTGPMEVAHADSLRDIGDMVLTSLTQDKPIRYGDGHQRAQFRRHFPHLVQPFDEWDSFPAQLEGRKRATLEYMRASWIDEWESWPTRASILNYAWAYVENNLTNPDPPDPQFELTDHGEAEGMLVLQGRSGNGTILRELRPPVTDGQRLEAEREVEDLIAWVRAMHSSDPATRWREVVERKRIVHSELEPQLLALRHSPNLSKTRCGIECEPL
jgi:hypothetical protein